jgi:hypothetical protein
MKSKRKVINCRQVGLRHLTGAIPASYRLAGHFAVGLNRLPSMEANDL